MAHIQLNDPIIGMPDASEELKVPANFDIIQDALNGNLDATNLLPQFLYTLPQIAGSSQVHNMAFGSGEMTGPASPGSPYSAIISVAHGLNAVPAAIFVTIAGGTQYLSVVGVPTDSIFLVEGLELPSGYQTVGGVGKVAYYQFGDGSWGSSYGNTTIPFYWLALS